MVVTVFIAGRRAIVYLGLVKVRTFTQKYVHCVLEREISKEKEKHPAVWSDHDVVAKFCSFSTKIEWHHFPLKDETRTGQPRMVVLWKLCGSRPASCNLLSCTEEAFLAESSQLVCDPARSNNHHKKS